MQKVIILAIVILQFSASIGMSQGLDSRQNKRIERLIEKGQYAQAWEMVSPLSVSDPTNHRINYLAGLIKLRLYQQEEALRFLLASGPDADQDYYTLLAEAYFQNDQLVEAREAISQLKAGASGNDKVQQLSSQFDAYEEIKLLPEKTFVKNMGAVINTDAHEYNGVMTQDQRSVVFTKRKKAAKQLAEDGLPYEEIYRATLDGQENWQPPVKYDSRSKSQHNATVALFDNDTKMITYREEDLFISELKEGIWTDPEPLDLVNDYGSAETHCFINDAFDTIFYASDYLSGGRDLDLFMITRQGEEWSEPVSLDELNTPYNDDAPFLADNGDFYFSSQGHNSTGGYDIFKTRLDPYTSSWSAPQNLGYPINSPSDDIYFNTFGKIAYLSSGRKGGFGNLDIYRVFLFNKVNIQGQVIDQQTNKALAGAIITVKGAEESVATSDEQGLYSVEVPIERVFEMNIEYENQLIYHEKQLAKVLFSDYNDNVIHLAVNITEEQVGYQDQPKEIAIRMVNDFETNPIEVVPSDTVENLLTLEVYTPELSPALVKQSEVQMEEGLPIIHFEYNNSSLSKNDKVRLLSLAKYLHQHPEKDLEIVGHTDLPGSSLYNQDLGLARAQEVKEFLVQLGISDGRVVLISKGEKDPVIVTEGKNEENRRAELNLMELYASPSQEIADN